METRSLTLFWHTSSMILHIPVTCTQKKAPPSQMQKDEMHRHTLGSSSFQHAFGYNTRSPQIWGLLLGGWGSPTADTPFWINRLSPVTLHLFHSALGDQFPSPPPALAPHFGGSGGHHEHAWKPTRLPTARPRGAQRTLPAPLPSPPQPRKHQPTHFWGRRWGRGQKCRN